MFLQISDLVLKLQIYTKQLEESIVFFDMEN
jgi:hypothetical protein